MISSLYNGLSGIITHEKAINVEGNNVANVNTAGYKNSQMSFQDLLYSGSNKGNGVTTDLISKQFIQGTIAATENGYDLAIDGDGYFVVKNDRKNETFYTRSGDFLKGRDGTLQTPHGLKILGTPIKNNEIVSSDPKHTKFDGTFDKFISSTTVVNKKFIQTINSATTDYEKTAKDIGKSGNGLKKRAVVIEDVINNLADYRAKLELYEGDATAPYKKSTKQIKKFSFSNIYDKNSFLNKNILRMSVNNTEVTQRFTKNDDPQEALNKFADKISSMTGLKAVADDKGSITIESLVPGKVDFLTYPAFNDDQPIETIISKPSLGSGKGLLDSARDSLKEVLELANAKFLEVTNTVNISTKEDLELKEIQLNPVVLNLYDDEVGVVEIEDGGGIFLKNGKNKFLVGKIETNFFRDDNELELIGENLYKETPSSGKPRNAVLRDRLVSHSLEKSNVSLSDTLVDLIVYQKAFEANAKSITTADELLKTAINLRK